MSDRTSGPVAIVTGAGGGVGEAVAVRLAGLGWDLVLTSRTESKLEAAVERVAAVVDGTEVVSVQADLTDPAAAAQVVERAGSAFGRLDGLVNVAGYASSVQLGEGGADQWRRTIDINVSATVYLTDAAWPALVDGDGGAVVNVSSMAAFDPFPGFVYYAPAKAAVNMFTRCAAEQGRDHGVRVLCVAPGAIETPMLRELFSTEQLPENKTLDPAEVAKVACDLLTGEHEAESGETVQLPSP